jgi:hypothetical protein
MAATSAHEDRYVIAARVRPGKTEAAARMLSAGPPFDPAEAGLSGHAAYLADDSVYLVFEGAAARTRALKLAREHLIELGQWQTIVRGLPSRVTEIPHDARCIYRWAAGASP